MRDPEPLEPPACVAGKVLRDGQVREEVVGCALRDERRPACGESREWPRRSAAVRSTPSATTRPRVGASSPASNRSSVDLPLPETPTSAVTAAARDLGVDVVQSLDDAGLARHSAC